MARTLLNVPRQRRARRGRRDPHADPAPDGDRLPPRRERRACMPRDIIRRFTCLYNDDRSSSAELHPAIAANPFLAFTHACASESGILAFTWEGDNGFAQTETRALTVA